MKLDVYANGEKLGVYVKRRSGETVFQYSDEWIAENRFPISLSLPLREDSYKGEKVNLFFENLLPDDPDVRQTIAERFHAEGTDAHSILYEIGRDCVGALQFLPEDVIPREPGKIEAEQVSDAEIAETIRELEYFPLGMDEDKPFRISLAGQQEKTTFLRRNDEWYRPLNTTPSTHIFKPQIDSGSVFRSVENEYFCMRLANRLGLKVPSVNIHTFENERVLLVERFDRRVIEGEEDGGIQRIHQEDFCQILERPVSRKYEGENEYLLPECLEQLQASQRVREDQKRFLRCQIVLWILGAGDGHLKNYSFYLSDPYSYRLTPFYDIISTEPYDKSNPASVERKPGNRGDGHASRPPVRSVPAVLALSVGPDRKRDPDKITVDDFKTLGNHTLLTGSEITDLLGEVYGRLDSALKETLDEAGELVPDSIVDPIVEAVKSRREILRKGL